MENFSLPKKGDYPANYEGYLELISDTDFCKLIQDQISDLEKLFSNKTSEWFNTPYEEGKWTPKEVLGHVIDTERIMTFRGLCFARGERSALPGFDQDPYVLNARFGQVPEKLLFEDFVAQRKALVTLIKTLSEDMLDFAGEANGSSITPRALFWIIPGHFIHHLRILKNRY
ncbi:MAG: DinB family protein [Algoriphagus sp.]|uniref:DinB family protein n=1 Tax=Algoriphagus sp. TaxID=1872435 RepID=UPI0017E4B1C9|nr:DinB family protein [Algoriphagus sp.]NVJ85536.1 DinB family protein [Algoriphagus sp.]